MWKGEWKGKALPDAPENYHQVTIDLSTERGRDRLARPGADDPLCWSQADRHCRRVARSVR